MRSLFISAVAAVALSACAHVTPNMKQNAMLVNNGDSKEKVIQTMGPPIDRQTHGILEAVSYCSSSMTGAHDITTFFLASNQVYSIKSYRGFSMNSCESAIPMMKWDENPPGATVEIRNR